MELVFLWNLFSGKYKKIFQNVVCWSKVLTIKDDGFFFLFRRLLYYNSPEPGLVPSTRYYSAHYLPDKTSTNARRNDRRKKTTLSPLSSHGIFIPLAYELCHGVFKFLACLYESTGGAIAITMALHWLKFLTFKLPIATIFVCFVICLRF